jgi:hypothetical protein
MQIALHVAVVTLVVVPLTILVFFLVALTTGGVVLILLLLKMPRSGCSLNRTGQVSKGGALHFVAPAGPPVLPRRRSILYPPRHWVAGVAIDFSRVLNRLGIGHDFFTLYSPLSRILFS